MDKVAASTSAMAFASPTTLLEIGTETIKLLDQVKAIRPEFEWPQALFEAEADRFELWAVNLGLFVPGHGSLDYRVREAENLASTLLRFMTDLNRSLSETLEYCDSDKQLLGHYHDNSTESPPDEFQKSFDDDMENDTNSESESDVDLLLESIRDSINGLYKLSTRIRNPASRLGSTKAQSYQQVDPETGVDLLPAFEPFDYDYVNSLFLEYRKLKALGECQPSIPSSHAFGEEQEGYIDHVWEPLRTVLSQHQADILNNTESFLVRRISQANMRRRRQFAYWKKHRNKLDQHASSFTKSSDVSKDMLRNQDHVRQSPANLSDPIIHPEHSVTTATCLNIPQMGAIYEQSTVSVSEYAPSAWQPGKEVVSFPSPPKQPEEGEKFFECPYCFILCSTGILTSKAWNAHLIHDLRPYICTYEDCRNPDQQYDNRQDWISHEDSSHRRIWRCPEHSTKTFFQLKEYQEHLQSYHPSHDNGKPNNPMVEAGESILTSADRCCPICSLSIETAKALQSHVALHLERFSLFSLPRSVDTSDDDEERDSNAAQGDGVESVNASIHTESFIDIPQTVILGTERQVDNQVFTEPPELTNHLIWPIMPFRDASEHDETLEQFAAGTKPTSVTTGTGLGSEEDAAERNANEEQAQVAEELETSRPKFRHGNWDQKRGRYIFERFRDSVGASPGYPVDHQRVHVNYEFHKSKWGVIGSDKRPAGIIYLDFKVFEPFGRQLARAIISVTLDDENPELYANSDRPMSNSQYPVQMTDFYGPKRFSGTGAQENIPASEWDVLAQLLPGTRHPSIHKTLRWELFRNNSIKKLRSLKMHTAFTFEHNNQPFFMRIKIRGELKDSPTRSFSQDNGHPSTTLIDFTENTSFKTPLDDLANRLERDIVPLSQTNSGF